jgi:hypothetical protein
VDDAVDYLRTTSLTFTASEDMHTQN